MALGELLGLREVNTEQVLGSAASCEVQIRVDGEKIGPGNKDYEQELGAYEVARLEAEANDAARAADTEA